MSFRAYSPPPFTPFLLIAFTHSPKRLYPHRLRRLRRQHLQHRQPLHSTPGHNRARRGASRFRERSHGWKRRRYLATTPSFLDGQLAREPIGIRPQAQVLLADHCWCGRVLDPRHCHFLPLCTTEKEGGCWGQATLEGSEELSAIA